MFSSVKGDPVVKGVDLDAQTRCMHYHSLLDIVAIKMACCQTYYACKDCHEALADHPLEAWSPEQSEEPAVACGMCRQQLTIRHYLECGSACRSAGPPSIRGAGIITISTSLSKKGGGDDRVRILEEVPSRSVTRG